MGDILDQEGHLESKGIQLRRGKGKGREGEREIIPIL
jgi:hypothetical protein